MTDQQQQQHQVKSQDFLASLAAFFQRDLISIPVIKKYPHQAFQQRCQLKVATLELDTAAYPNIEYIAGNRLSVYPINPSDQVTVIMKHLVDDISQAMHGTTAAAAAATAQPPINKRTKTTTSGNNNSSGTRQQRLSDPWAKFLALNGRESVRLALTYVYDITSPPTRNLLRLMAENCSRAEHRKQLISISKTDESWQKWICLNLRTLRSTFEEFPTCSLSAKSLFSELTLQQPRQYSISSIKSSKRFRAEIIVFQHHFNNKQISQSLQRVKELERSLAADNNNNINRKQPASPAPKHSIPMPPMTVHVNHNVDQERTSNSIRSLRSMINPTTYYSTSPISRQQVSRVPNYAGPLMSMYASATATKSSSGSSAGNSPSTKPSSHLSLRDNQSVVSLVRQQLADTSSLTGSDTGTHQQQQQQHSGKLYEGLCSNYLLALNTNDHIVCEFVENPRFTLKGNRERPIIMIGQDLGLIAYRSFWQQRSLEHDRAQVFYTLFKDLPQKKFGDMQLVCLTGDKCRVEEMFKREISQMLTTKIISTFTCINRNHLRALYESAAISSQTGSVTGASGANSKVKIESRELFELGARIAKLLIENNGCLYTCCDAQMTQAIEILTVESIARLGQMSREQIMTLLPKWKGRRQEKSSSASGSKGTGKGRGINHHHQQQLSSAENTNDKQFLFTLENQFERAQVVEEIYDSSI